MLESVNIPRCWVGNCHMPLSQDQKGMIVGPQVDCQIGVGSHHTGVGKGHHKGVGMTSTGNHGSGHNNKGVVEVDKDRTGLRMDQGVLLWFDNNLPVLSAERSV